MLRLRLDLFPAVSGFRAISQPRGMKNSVCTGSINQLVANDGTSEFERRTRDHATMIYFFGQCSRQFLYCLPMLSNDAMRSNNLTMGATQSFTQLHSICPAI